MSARARLLEQQRRILLEAQRDARARGIVAEKRDVVSEPIRTVNVRDDRVRTFDQYCRQENARLRPYSWITTSPYQK